MAERIVIMGAGGRDFHDFNAAYRDDPHVQVVAFTATQIPGIAGRIYPPSLAGPRYPEGIPIVDEAELGDIIVRESVDRVLFAYSDLAHIDVMHKASAVLAAGAGFGFTGPNRTMVQGTKPVIAVCAARTGSGKSQTSRLVGRLLAERGHRVSLVRHPMPYGALERMAVQRFETLADIDASAPTIEEREEYEAPVSEGLLVWAGVDYAAILAAAEAESDVIVWDGGNNDTPFFRPDLSIVVLDALRPGHELTHHPGELNLRMADAVVINKVDAAGAARIAEIEANVASVNPGAEVLYTASPVMLEDGPDLAGAAVLVVEDGPTITHGGMPHGAGTVATLAAGGVPIDPRPHAVGSIADTFRQYPHIGSVLPAMGYGAPQLAELEATIAAVPCDVVVTGTPIDLGRIIDVPQPVRHATYRSVEVGGDRLGEIVAGVVG